VNAPTRKWKRFKVDIRIRIRRSDEAGVETTAARAFELSEGGMSVYASEALEVGTPIQLELLLLSTDKPLRVRAMVRSRRGFRCGMEFMELAAADKSEIQAYLGALADIIEIPSASCSTGWAM